MSLYTYITKKPIAKAERREVLEGSVQHTETQSLIKIELYFRGKINCELTSN